MRATRNTSVQPKLEPNDPPPMPQQTRYSLRKTAARKEAILGTTKTASPVQKARKKTKSKAKERQATVKVKVTPKQKPSKKSRPIFTAQDLATYERLKRLNPHGTAAEEYLKKRLNRPSWLGTGDTPPDPNRKFDEAFFRRRDLKWKTLYGVWRYYGRWEGVAGETSKEWWAKYREEVHDRALVYSNAAWKGRRRIVRIFGSDGRRRVRFVIPNVTRKRPLDVDGDEDEEEEGRRIRRRCEVNGDQPRGWFPVVRMENVLKWAAAAALVTLAIR